MAAAAVAPLGWLALAAGPAAAQNPCNAQGKYSPSSDIASVRVTNSGCPNIGVRMQYQPPSSGTYYTYRHKAWPVGGTAYSTGSEPQALNWSGCSNASDWHDCSGWSAKYQITAWATFS